MATVKSFHCAYDTHYHIVFPVKYRKALIYPKVETRIHEISLEIGNRYEIELEQIGCDLDHIHLLCSFHPKYSIGLVVRKYKSITARELFKTFPELKKELWGGEFWSSGYYAATVGTGGSWEVVENYVKNQGKQPKAVQLRLF